MIVINFIYGFRAMDCRAKKLNIASMNIFQGRKLVITTKHGKGAVLAPALERLLGVDVYVHEGFDTDSLGTFSGEVERKLSPLEAARTKCLQGMQDTGTDLGLANEGSFGPHPHLFFLPCNEEFLCLIDKKNGLEIVVKELSLDTNYDHSEIKSWSELESFAAGAKFPSHALILRNKKSPEEEIFKGIRDLEELQSVFDHLISKNNSVFVETDMRAMLNPSRMKFIGQLGEKLAEKMLCQCPQCQTPGYSIQEAKRGLPCAFCGQPTQGLLSHVWSCQKCGHSEEKFFPNEKSEEDPMYCDHCNP